MQETQILIDMIKEVRNTYRNWTADKALKGGICAYNRGPSNVNTNENMDVGTADEDYANDVTARSQFFKRNGY